MSTQKPSVIPGLDSQVDITKFVEQKRIALMSQLKDEMALSLRSWLERALPVLIQQHHEQPLVTTNTIHGNDATGNYELAAVVRWEGKHDGVEEDNIYALYKFDVWVTLTAYDKRQYVYVWLHELGKVVTDMSPETQQKDVGAWRVLLDSTQLQVTKTIVDKQS